MNKPNSPSCERNKDPILGQLLHLFHDRHKILEVGSGTGQHAVYFASQMNHLFWQTSDMLENHKGIQLWLEESTLTNVGDPIELDVNGSNWNNLCRSEKFDGIFTANTLHIMGPNEVELFFLRAREVAQSQCRLVIYGPFNYQGEYTSESNAQFDIWLQNRDPKSRIRDFNWVCQLGHENGFQFSDDIEMPANNRMLVFDL